MNIRKIVSISGFAAAAMLASPQPAHATHDCPAGSTAPVCSVCTSVAIELCLESADDAFNECDALYEPFLTEIICTPELIEDTSDCIQHTGDFDFDAALAACVDADADADGDGVPDFDDPCVGFPNDDTDLDGVCDSDDVCPTDDADADDDNDGVCDVVDVCVGADNVDSDGDQICDDLDICVGIDASGDIDLDGTCDSSDNCPQDANPDQEDADNDTIGDVCEVDGDADGVVDDDDNCPNDANSDQSDLDGDGDGDACDDDDDGDAVADEQDNCPFYANADQTDGDDDGYGDVCDGDDDGDGVDDDDDLCPGTALDALFDSNGCSGEQLVEVECGVPSDFGWNHRSDYVRCVVKTSRSAWRKGLISRAERAWFIRRSVRAVWASYRSRLRRWC